MKSLVANGETSTLLTIKILKQSNLSLYNHTSRNNDRIDYAR